MDLPLRPPGRSAMTLISLASLLLAILAILCATLVLTGIATAVVGVGLILLLMGVPLLGMAAGLQTRLAERGLRRRTPVTYAPTAGLPVSSKMRVWATDPMRWRSLVWTFYSMTIGAVLSAVVVALAVAPLWYFVWFWLWLGLRDTFDDLYGVMTIDSAAVAAIAAVVQVLLSLLLWWVLVRPLTRLRLILDTWLLVGSREEALERRVAEVTTSREQSVDASAAELRRVERDLHDGAQARLAALGMGLGLAEELIHTDPAAAAALLAEARGSANAALGDIRDVVRGIHPPVLADRGVAAAIQALCVDQPFVVDTDLAVTRRLAPPLESALYFSVAECIANIGKHARATVAWVRMAEVEGVICIEVGDNGVGGAVATGSGLQGVVRRLGAFDGRMQVSSPTGGPTLIQMEVPCESSSARTTPSFAMD